MLQVAASRAIAQNNNLKKQLEELQEAVVHLVGKSFSDSQIFVRKV